MAIRQPSPASASVEGVAKSSRIVWLLVLITAVIAGTWPAAAFAATQPRLGTALNFAVLAGSAIPNTGPTVITGDLGLSPGTASSVTGFPPGTVTGIQHTADAVALQAQTDLVTAYTDAATSPSTSDLTGQDLGGQNLTPGVYTFSSAAQLTGPLTLSGNGVFIFQIGSTLTTASNSVVNLSNGAQACAVYWQVGTSATLGSTTQFQGNLMALSSITMNTGANILTGRALARNGALTLDTNRITPPAGTCTVATTTTGAVTGTVTSASGGAAISGATVTDSGGASATTNGSGVYTLSGLAAGSHTLTAAAAGFTTSTAQTASVTAGQTTPGVNFSLTPTPTLPKSGGPPQQPGFPWWPLAIAGAIGVLLLGLRMRTYHRDS
jgi:hypothetical protein